MDESPRYLNKPLIEKCFDILPSLQPKLFEDVVGFVVELFVEAFEIAQVMGLIVRVILAIGDESGDFRCFMTHG